MSRKKEPVEETAKILRIDAEKVARSVLYDSDKAGFIKLEDIVESANIHFPTGNYTLEEMQNTLLELQERLEVEVNKRGRYRLTEMGRLHHEREGDFEQILYSNYLRRLIERKGVVLNDNVVKPIEKKLKAQQNTVKKDRLQLLSVNIQSERHPNGVKRCAMVISNDPKSLEHDVKLGAAQFKSILEANPVDLSSKVVFFRVKTKEDGLFAVKYLAPLHFQMDHVSEFDCISSENLDLANYNPNGGEGTYMNVCPIVPIGELINPEDSVPFGLGNVASHMRALRNTAAEPYWFQHMGPVVLVCGNNSSVYDPEGTLLSEAISALGRKSRIYVVNLEADNFIFDAEGEEDMDHGDAKLIAALDRYDAAVFPVVVKDRRGYMTKVLEGLCDKYGLAIPSDYPKDKLIERVDATFTDMKVTHLHNLLRREARRNKDGVLGDGLLKLLGKLDTDSENNKEGREKLYSLEGMDQVKNAVESLIDAMKLSKARRTKGLKSEQIACVMFTGAPGTGKTEVAGCLAKMLAAEGVLPGKRFVSLTAAGLQGEYVGSTVGRVQEIFAQNDVIFLDEAYSLSDLMKQHVPFAEEAMATLLCEIENAQRTGSKLVILGGYGGSKSDEKTNKMAEFLKSNPGIRSRIAMTVEFENYSAEEMGRIFIRICNNDGYEFTSEEAGKIRDKVTSYFETRMGKADFGNAREARQLVGEAERFTAMRIMRGRSMTEVAEDELRSMTLEDICDAIASITKMQTSQNGRGERLFRMIG